MTSGGKRKPRYGFEDIVMPRASSPPSGRARQIFLWINSRKPSPLCAIENDYQSRFRGTDGGRGDPEPAAAHLAVRAREIS
jgi:hypothetical protein